LLSFGVALAYYSGWASLLGLWLLVVYLWDLQLGFVYMLWLLWLIILVALLGLWLLVVYLWDLQLGCTFVSLWDLQLGFV
jgi:hypothetical protein